MSAQLLRGSSLSYIDMINYDTVYFVFFVFAEFIVSKPSAKVSAIWVLRLLQMNVIRAVPALSLLTASKKMFSFKAESFYEL